MVYYLKENKKILLSTIALAFCAHAIKFFNYYPTWDSMYGIKTGWLGMAVFGRWFSGIAEIVLSSRYDLQWVEGIEAILFMALICSLIINIFDIKNKYYQWCTVALFVTFPSFAATFMYGLWTPAYMLSLFLACLSVYLCIRKDNIKSLGISILCMMFSLAIYQIYFLFSASLIVIYMLITIMKNTNCISRIKNIVIRYSIISVSSMLLYAIIGKCLQSIFHYELSEYQGVSQVGSVSFITIYNAIWTTISYCKQFFFGERGVSIYGVLNIIIIVMIFIIIIKNIVFNKDISLVTKLLVLCGYMILIPMTYLFLFVSPGVWYHRLMELGNYALYLFPIIILCFNEKKGGKHIEKLFVLLITILCFYHFLNNNIAYHQAAMSYERTYYEASEVIHEIDRVSKGDYKEILVLGEFTNVDTEIVAVPEITGASCNNFLHSEEHLLIFSKFYLNREYVSCPDNKRQEILNKVNQEQMDAYPYGDYVQLIDDTIVVNLSRN